MTYKPSNRREFLAGASGAALAAAAAGAAESQPPVRVAVVGTGARGSDLIRNLSTIESAEIVAVCDDYEPHLLHGHKFAGAQAKAFDNYSKMLKEMKPQAVVVATPLYLHHPMCLEAIDAGCHVFCEKTMCYSIDEARELADVVKKRGAVFQVGLQRRANAIYKQAQAMVQAGYLGRITAINCQWHRNNNWRRPVPVKRGEPKWSALEHRLNWRLYWDYSQGLMTELASHQMDIVNWLLGTPPKCVIGAGGIDYWRDGREVFDNIWCTYEYEVAPPKSNAVAGRTLDEENRYTVRVAYSSIQSNAYQGASELIMGDRGTLFFTQQKGLFYRELGVEDPGWSKDGRLDRDATIVTSGKTLKMSNDPWAHRGKPLEIDITGDDTREELLAFLDCVQREDPATISDAQNGLANTATVLIGNEATHSRQVTPFPTL
ncbi:MAG: Gfo/Idh/MocA family oxidoreductase [Planctomycetes bacterium]|nr:Gfo/Idh/MocA family oxidoreductase [Planctomycetota bacterium]